VLMDGVDEVVFMLYPDGPADVQPIDLESGASPAPARVLEVRIVSGRSVLSTRVLLRSAYGTGS
jgi:hypothetical protein